MDQWLASQMLDQSAARGIAQQPQVLLAEWQVRRAAGHLLSFVFAVEKNDLEELTLGAVVTGDSNCP
jgi:hypothetical protein